jgi:hypothetical protein
MEIESKGYFFPLFSVRMMAERCRKVEERIGEALVRIGAMSTEQVDQVLKIQKDGDDRLFGEIAIEQGFINDQAIQTYLESKN